MVDFSPADTRAAGVLALDDRRLDARAFDIERLRAALALDAACLGICPEFRCINPQFDLRVYDELASTNTQLWKLLGEGAGAGTVAIARRQSSGRGQWGRVWQSGPGGLYLSLAISPDWPVTHSVRLTYLSAWGIATAFHNLGLPVRVKWPNDLFFEGKKLGGILTEVKLAQPLPEVLRSPAGNASVACIKQAVIGVGVNWHNSVPQSGVSLAKILETMPSGAAINKISCLEMLAALVLKGTLQGYFFYQQVGSQVFMKAYRKLLTQVSQVDSLGCGSLTQTVSARGVASADASPDVLAEVLPKAGRLANRSGAIGEIVEEGYLGSVLQASRGHLPR